MKIKDKLSDKDLCTAVIIAISFSVYANTLLNGFVYDDNDQILNNRWITDFRYIPDIFFSSVWSFMEDRPPSVNYYRPVMNLIFNMEYHLFGLNPAWWHLVNIIIHTGNSILFFLITTLIIPGSSSRINDNNNPRNISPFIAAVLFAVHPVNTEVTAWVSAVPELSFTLFSLSAIYLYIKQPYRGYPFLSAFFFFLALLSKETAVMLPFILLFYDFLIRPAEKESPGLIGTSLKRYSPFMAMAAVYALMRVYALSDMALQKPEHQYLKGFEYLLNIFQLIYLYFNKLLFPISLNIFHDFHPADSFRDIIGIVFISVAFGYAILIFLGIKTWRISIFAVSWIIIFLTPALYTLGITENPFAERYMYLPSAGYAFLLASGLNGIRLFCPAPHDRTLFIPVSIFLIIASLYSIGTISRNFSWRDDPALWADAVSKSPFNSTVHYNLGTIYQNKGMLKEAKKEYLESIRLNPRYADVHYQLGKIYLSWYLLDSAIAEFQEALRIKPDSREAQAELHKISNLKQLQ